MNASKEVRIEIEAAKALVAWKYVFGTEVCKEAKRLAAQSGCSEHVTLSHYRIAAQLAIQTLAEAVRGERPDGQQEAA